MCINSTLRWYAGKNRSSCISSRAGARTSGESAGGYDLTSVRSSTAHSMTVTVKSLKLCSVRDLISLTKFIITTRVFVITLIRVKYQQIAHLLPCNTRKIKKYFGISRAIFIGVRLITRTILCGIRSGKSIRDRTQNKTKQKLAMLLKSLWS